MVSREDWEFWLTFAALVAAGIYIYNHQELPSKAENRPGDIQAASSSASGTATSSHDGMIELFRGKDATVYRFDPGSVRGDRRSRDGWLLAEASRGGRRNWQFHRVHYLVDCNTAIIHQLDSIYYNAEGKVLGPEAKLDPKDIEPEFYPEDTLRRRAFNALCAVGSDALK